MIAIAMSQPIWNDVLVRPKDSDKGGGNIVTTMKTMTVSVITASLVSHNHNYDVLKTLSRVSTSIFNGTTTATMLWGGGASHLHK